MNVPKISVIIPMYNAEKFIRQTLISVLASKFADYEVIVVDDCSTDNSVAEVEKLLPHFDGRLKILSTEKNSGSAGVPRNIGIEHAAGKYITFVDNDDMIVPTALADFFNAAEKFQADVVYAEKFLYFTAEEFNPKDLKPRFQGSVEELIDEPTLEPANLLERIRRDIAKKFYILPWDKLYRRDFLLKNKIRFPQMRFSEDLTFCFKCLCLAKNYLRVPQITNIRRERMNSTARIIIDSKEGVRQWLDILFRNIADIDAFMGKLKFFAQNPDVRRDVLNYYIGVHFGIIKNLFTSKQPHEVPQIFYDELQNPALNQHGKDLVAAYLFAERVASLNA